uniref:hypothetical protein n=1 Tax=Klebsiella pneumoniae TaxID=573 RepID=UPI00358EEF11
RSLSEVLKIMSYTINAYHDLLCIQFLQFKIQSSGAGPVAQRLSSHILLLGGPGFASSDPECGHGTA